MSRILAFDFGASSGRAMIGTFDGEKITMEEIHRFTNDPVTVGGTMYWDYLRLVYNIKTAISKAVNMGGFDSIGIDTWGVDYALIGKDGQVVDNPIHYRDSRTDDYNDFWIQKDEIYEKSGIQDMQINTLYQLASVVKKQPEKLGQAEKLLFIPDLFNYVLTGVMKSEYTEASTSQLLDAKKRDWNWDLIRKAKIPEKLFCEIVHPGEIIGKLSDELCEELGAPKADVVAIGSHDTASAIAAAPTEKEDFIYISSGTWCLLGTELSEPIISEKAFKHNYTNEGGVNKTICFIKNRMGTWLIQESRRQWIREGKEYDFGTLEKMAVEVGEFGSYIDVDDPMFIKPGNLPRRVKEYCEKTGQKVPKTEGEVIRCINESLVKRFKEGIDALIDCTEKDYDTIHILGGGTKSALLCQLTADKCRMKVVAGPDEATVLGNIAVQLMARGEIKDIAHIRKVIANSCKPKTYIPR